MRLLALILLVLGLALVIAGILMLLEDSKPESWEQLALCVSQSALRMLGTRWS